MAYFAGVDLGASNMRAIVADGEARTVSRTGCETPQGPDGTVVEAALRDLVRSVCADAGLAPTDLVATAVASTGPLDLAAGTVENPANIPRVDRIRIQESIAEVLDGGPVYVHNDATAGVIGERFFSDPNPDDMAYLTISSGIGTGLCVDGHVLGGWDGNAGEIGHLVLDPSGRRTCGCGRNGHWEAYCSGDNIPDYARDLQAEDPVDTTLPLSDPGFVAADVFARAGSDPLADRVVDAVARWNAIGVANLVYAYAPLEVAIGGAVALENPELVVDPIRDRLEPLVFTGVPDVRTATMGQDAVVRGAVASAITEGTGER